MRKSLIAFVCCSFVNACSTLNPSATSIKWDGAQSQNVKYRTAILWRPNNIKKLEINALELVDNPELSQPLFDQLKVLPIKAMRLPYLTSIKPLDSNHLEVKMVSVPIEYEAPPVDEREKSNREFSEKIVGMIQLAANIDLHGDLNSFYLRQQQKNVVSMFFHLPGSPVNVGDQWKNPSILTTLSNGFFADSVKRRNDVTLVGVRIDQQLGRIAEITYTLVEVIEGKVQSGPSNNKNLPPFSISAVYIGVGEFLIDKGYWKQYRGQLSIKGSGSTPVDTYGFMILHPVES